MNNNVIKGTPLINSIYITLIVLITGIFDCRPSAKRIPIGNDAIIPTDATIIVRSNPPHLSVSTYSNPKPPEIRVNAMIGKDMIIKAFTLLYQNI